MVFHLRPVALITAVIDKNERNRSRRPDALVRSNVPTLTSSYLERFSSVYRLGQLVTVQVAYFALAYAAGSDSDVDIMILYSSR